MFTPAQQVQFAHVQPNTHAGLISVFQQAQPTSHVGQPPAQPEHTGPTAIPGHETILPHAFNTETLQDLASGACTMDTSASSHLNDSVTSLSDVCNTCIYPSVLVGDGHTIPVTNTGHNFMTRRVLLQCDSTGDVYPVMQPSPIPHAFLTSQHTWHQQLGHPRSEVLRRLVSRNLISCNKEKPLVLFHACQLGKHRSLYGLKQAPELGFSALHLILPVTPVDIESKRGDDVQQVCLYMHDPQEPHFSALKRILRYVRGTLDYGLQLFSSSTRCGLGWLPYYSEIDFRNLLRELHIPFSFATLVYYDNVSAVYLSSIPDQHRRTKHIEIDIHFIRDLVAAGQVRVLHVPSRYQYADIFTKGLPPTLFEEFRTSLSVRCSPTPTVVE
ncbi:ribonuclease H-like domain-containing protein [Tanacetum coccineum]